MTFLNALIAVGGNSRAARAARAKMQWRDRFGRWIEMGRGVKFKVRRGDGSVVSVNGVFSGATDNPEFGQVHVTNDPSGLRDGFYQVKSNNGQAILASLDPTYLKKQGIETGKDQQGNPVGERSDADIPNEADMVRRDSPLGWASWGKRGSFITDDREFVLSPRPQNLVAADGKKYTLTRKGQTLGTFEDWPEAIAKVDNIDAGGKVPTPDAPETDTTAPSPEEAKRTPDSDFSPAVSDPKERAKNAVAEYDTDGAAARLIDAGATSQQIIDAMTSRYEKFKNDKNLRDYPADFPSKREKAMMEKMDARLDALRNLDRTSPGIAEPKQQFDDSINGRTLNPDGSQTSVVTGKTTAPSEAGRLEAERRQKEYNRGNTPTPAPERGRGRHRLDVETGGTAAEGFLVPVPGTESDKTELTAQVIAEFIKQNKADLSSGGKRLVIDFDDKGGASLSVADTVATKPEADQLALERDNAADIVDLTSDNTPEETPDATEPEVSDPSAEQPVGDDGRADPGLGDPVGGEVQPEPTDDDGLTPFERALLDRISPPKPGPAGDPDPVDSTDNTDKPLAEQDQEQKESSERSGTEIAGKLKETTTPAPEADADPVEAERQRRIAEVTAQLKDVEGRIDENERKMRESKERSAKLAEELKKGTGKDSKLPEPISTIDPITGRERTKAQMDLELSKVRARRATQALNKSAAGEDRAQRLKEATEAYKEQVRAQEAVDAERKARLNGDQADKLDPSPETTEQETPDESGNTDTNSGGSPGVPDGVGTGEPGLERPEDSGSDGSGDVLGTPVDRPARFDALEAQGVKTVPLFEIPSENAKDFRDAIETVRTGSPFGAAVYVYDEAEYKDMRLFMNDDKTAGVAVKSDGDIVSVFVQPGSKDKGGARSLIATAVDQGGTKLDAFDTVLPGLYAKEGFQPTGRSKWNDEYAPENWDADTFSAYNNGKPDVVFMEYDEANLDGTYTPGSGDYLEDEAPGGEPVTPEEQNLLEEVSAEPNIERIAELNADTGSDLGMDVDTRKGAAYQNLQNLLTNEVPRPQQVLHMRYGASVLRDEDGNVTGVIMYQDRNRNKYLNGVTIGQIFDATNTDEAKRALFQDAAKRALDSDTPGDHLIYASTPPNKSFGETKLETFMRGLGAEYSSKDRGWSWTPEATKALADGNFGVDTPDETPVDSDADAETPSVDGPETETEDNLPPMPTLEQAEDLKVDEEGDLVEKEFNEHPENQTEQPADEPEDITNGGVEEIDESVSDLSDPDGPNEDELPVTGGEVVDFGYRDSPEDYSEEKFMPTDEQRDIVMAVLGEKDVAVQALAGTGKTSTLELIARRMQKVFPQKRILYIAFNKSVQTEAEGRMPANVESRTGDSLAWQGIDKKLTAKRQNTGALIMPSDIASEFGIRGIEDMDSRDVVRGLNQVIKNFAISEDDYIGEKHFPKDGADTDVPFVPETLDWANAMWNDIKSPEGKLAFRNDHATKIWALSRPDLSKYGSGAKSPAQTIFFDEAQDINPVMARVVREQSIQKVYVGDGRQAIYGFRGAENELDKVSTDVTLPLQKSWRFGPQVAGMGNRFLSMLGSPYKVTGGGQAGEVVESGTMTDADVVITRTNGGALKEIIRELASDRRVGISKAYRDELQSLVDTAEYLQRGGRKPRMNEDLAGYKSWSEVQDDVAEGKADRKVTMLHNLVERYQLDGLQDAIDRTVVPSETPAGDANAPAPLDMTEGGKGVFMPGVNYQVSQSAKGVRIDLMGPKTFMNKDSFKSQGFRFDGQKKSWYFENPSATTVLEKANAARGVTGEQATALPADVIITTAHKSKGLEWDRVRIADDFWGPKADPETGEVKMPAPEELRLNYVAVTRAAKALDPGSLGWVLDYTDDEDEDPAVPSKGLPSAGFSDPTDATEVPGPADLIPSDLPDDPRELDRLAEKLERRALENRGTPAGRIADDLLDKVNVKRNRVESGETTPTEPAEEEAPEPVPTPEPEPEPRTFFSDSLERLARDLPATSGERATLGIEEYETTTNASMAEVYVQTMGGTPEQLRAKIPALREKEARLKKLNDYLWAADTPDPRPTKWPAELKTVADELNYGRKQPKTSVGPIGRELQQTSASIRLLESQANEVQIGLDRINALPDRPQTLRRASFDESGNLDEKTQKALDATLAAGQAIDLELDRRLKERGLDREQLEQDDKRVVQMTRTLINTTPKSDTFRTLVDERGALQDSIKERRAALNKAQAEEALAILSEIREMGGGNRSEYKDNGDATETAYSSMEVAHSIYPNQWNDWIADRFPSVNLRETPRGYNHKGTTIALSRTSWKDTNLDTVAVHELGHSMEEVVPGLKNLEWAYHYQRSDKETGEDGSLRLKPAKPLFAEGQSVEGRIQNEKYHNDAWVLKYTGKTYSEGAANPAAWNWEVFTTGVESLFGNSDYFTGDPEFRQFILGAISAL